MYETPKAFYDSLKRQAKKGNLEFRGKYHMEDGEDTTAKARVVMVALEIWKVTGYRFTYVENARYKRDKT